jgi:hypothetical protein
MATAPPPGGIVTVPDTGGAPTITAEIINAMWNAAANKTTEGDKYIKEAIDLAQPAPHMAYVDLDTSYLPPVAPAFPTMDPGDGENIYNEKVREILLMIQNSFVDFMATYFPNSDIYEKALAWCERAIVDGGTGMNPAAENALFQRDRARLFADSERETDEAFATWSNRRFPIPPGSLTGKVNEINLTLGRKLAESSRTVMTKSWDSELENVRFAVKTVVDQYIAALNAAGDYVKVLILGPQTAMQLATGLTGLQAQYYNALTSYYTAQVTAAQPAVQLAIADANLKAEVGKANLAAQGQSIDSMVKAAMAGAQMLASQAASGINAINAQSSISGQDTTSN